jgi:hypothetical protein
MQKSSMTDGNPVLARLPGVIGRETRRQDPKLKENQPCWTS